MNKSAKRFALGTIIAAAAGYIAGLLTAPKSGKETREDIKQAAELSISEAEKQLKKLHTQMDQAIKEGQVIITNVEGKARKEFEAAIAVTKASKEKARQILSAVHEGHADSEELNQAVTEASSAIKHLKKYVKSAS